MNWSIDKKDKIFWTTYIILIILYIIVGIFIFKVSSITTSIVALVFVLIRYIYKWLNKN